MKNMIMLSTLLSHTSIKYLKMTTAAIKWSYFLLICAINNIMLKVMILVSYMLSVGVVSIQQYTTSTSWIFSHPLKMLQQKILYLQYYMWPKRITETFRSLSAPCSYRSITLYITFSERLYYYFAAYQWNTINKIRQPVF